MVYKLRIEKADTRIFPLVHVSRLKPYVSRHRRPRERIAVEFPFELDEALLPEDSWIDDNEGSNEYEVEEILDVRYITRLRNGRRQKEYLIKWIGYEEATWESEDNLSCTALLYEFDAKCAWRARHEAAQTAEEDDSDDACDDWSGSEEAN